MSYPEAKPGLHRRGQRQSRRLVVSANSLTILYSSKKIFRQSAPLPVLNSVSEQSQSWQKPLSSFQADLYLAGHS